MKAMIRPVDHTMPTAREAALPPEGIALRLSRTRGATVRRALGWRVRAMHGEVWITQDGDIRDIVLRAGEEYVVDRADPVLMWTLGDADASLVIRPREASGQRAASPAVARPAYA